MGFTKETKERAFVASARRCCVCKEFKGRNLEVHHVIPKSDGGKDTFENAIPLCFDCHANAGHYNSKHPRGSKFSRTELKMHRDQWYNQVKNGLFSETEHSFTQQFFLTNSFDIVSEIVKGDFDRFPLNQVLLLQNDLGKYLQTIKQTTPIGTDLNEERKKYYGSIEAYLSMHPDAQEKTNTWGQSEYIRIPSKKELWESFADKEFIVNYMIRNGVPPEEISRAVFYEFGCADGCAETFEFREAKAVFLALINTSNQPASLSKVVETYIDDGGFVQIDNVGSDQNSININNLIIGPGACLLIPYCILVLEFENPYEAKEGFTYEHIGGGQMQDVRRITLNTVSPITIGPRHFVNSLEFSLNDLVQEVEIKDFDPKHLLLISRFWECGSCPHIFLKKERDNWEYLGELFSNSPNKLQKKTLDFSHSTYTEMKIIEIEDEITYINDIVLDGKVFVSNIKLVKGEEITIPIHEIREIKISGSYELIDHVKYVEDQKMKSQKIAFKLADMNN